MTTFLLSPGDGTIRLPSREELGNMLRNPWVACVAMVCATLIILGAVGGIVFLAYNGRGTEAIGALVLGVLGLVLGRIRAVQQQTNGHMTRVLDAALPPNPAEHTFA